jgi:MFS family permease
VIFSAIAAVSVNMGMFIVFRLLIGDAAASVQSVGSGTIADMWEPKERGKAMSIFIQGPLCDPGLAPIIGGALTKAFGWRSIQWLLTGFGGLVLTPVLFCLPGTVGRKTVRNEDGGPGPKLTIGSFLFNCVKPLRILGLLRNPAIFVAVYAAGISFGVMFVRYVELQATFPFAP